MKPEIKISKHARDRYVERIIGFNVNQINKLIMTDLETPSFQKIIERFGNARFTYKSNGISYCFEGMTLTTCYPIK